MFDRGRRQFITLLGAAAAAWPLPPHAQETANLTIATEPQVEIARVKSTPNVLPNPRLSDRVVALTRGFSLSGAEGIGIAWEASPYIRPADEFNERYGGWCGQGFRAQNRLPWYNYLSASSPCQPRVDGMNRRSFITLLGGAAAWPLAVRAQRERMRRSRQGGR